MMPTDSTPNVTKFNEAPPRPIGFTMVGVRLLLDNLSAFFGSLVLALGLFLMAVFSWPSYMKTLIVFEGTLKQAKGTVVASEETNISEDDYSLYKIYFSFKTPNGDLHEGASYQLGSSLADGKVVTVEYAPQDPGKYARIQRLRHSSAPSFSVFLALLPLAGFLLFGKGLLEGVRHYFLFRDGLLGSVRLVKTTVLNPESENPKFELQFELTTQEEEVFAFSRRVSDEDDVPDEAPEPMLYRAGKPAKNVFLKQLPGSPSVDDQKSIHYPYEKPWNTLAAPAVLFATFLMFLTSLPF